MGQGRAAGLRRVGLGLGAIVLAATAVHPAADARQGSCASADLAQAVSCTLAAERGKRRLPPLRASRRLRLAAGRHAADMVAHGYFSHRSRDGRTPMQRVRATGYAPRRAGEAMAFGSGAQASARSLVTALLRSPSHRRLLLARRFRHLGVAVQPGLPVRGGGDGVTVVLVVGARRSA